MTTPTRLSDYLPWRDQARAIVSGRTPTDDVGRAQARHVLALLDVIDEYARALDRDPTDETWAQDHARLVTELRWMHDHAQAAAKALERQPPDLISATTCVGLMAGLLSSVTRPLGPLGLWGRFQGAVAVPLWHRPARLASRPDTADDPWREELRKVLG